MEYIGNGLFRIENIRTGEKRVVRKDELPNYNLSADKGFFGNLISSLAQPITETGRTMVAGGVQAPILSMAARAKQAAYSPETPEFLRGFGEKLSKGYESIGKTLEPIAYTPERYQRVSERPMEELTGQAGRSLQLGAYGIPVGSTFKGALAGGAGIGGVYSSGQQLAEKGQVDIGEAGRSALIGAGTGGILNLLGRGVSAIRGTSEPSTQVAGRIKQSTRQIKVKPSITAAGKEKSINQTLDKLGFKGSAQTQYENLEPAMQTLENKIKQEIANNPQAYAAKKDIINAFRESLKSSVRAGELTEAQAIKEANKYLGDLLKASGGTGKFTNIYLEQLRNLKKLVNEDYSLVQTAYDSGRPLTPRLKVIEAAWRSLDKAVKNASSEVKRLLSDESNLYKAAKSLSAARFNPPTQRIAGTSLPMAVTQKGRDVATDVLEKYSGIAGKVPQLPVEGIQKGGILSILAGRNVGEQGNQSQYPQDQGQDQGSQYNAPGDLQHTDTIPQEGNFVQNEDGSWSPRTTTPSEGVSGFPSKEEFRQAMFQAAQTGDERYNELESVYKMLYPEKAEKTGKVFAKDKALADTGLASVSEVRRMIQKDPYLLTKQLVPGKFFTREFDAALYNAVDALLRLRTGAQANPSEIRGYMSRLGPTFGDTAQAAEYKLKQLERDFNFYQGKSWVDEQVEAGIDIEAIKQELTNQGLDPNEYLQ